MIVVAVLLWAPGKILKYGFRWAIGTEAALDDLAMFTNQAIDDYIEANPL